MHSDDITPAKSYLSFNISRFLNGDEQRLIDQIVVEEPLEIRVGIEAPPGQPWIVTMRTPGYDKELVVGHLFSEGLIEGAGDILQIKSCGTHEGGFQSNTIFVRLPQLILDRIENSKRSQRMNSSCGLCGKDALSSIVKREFRNSTPPLLKMDQLLKVLSTFSEVDSVYKVTGGCHACAWVDDRGHLKYFFEDVGRHNALDKLIGRSLMDGQLDLNSGTLLLSGRVSFEMIEKAVSAKVSTILSVGAPSSLAVDLAKEYNINLFGFGKSQSVNIYHHVDWL